MGHRSSYSRVLLTDDGRIERTRRTYRTHRGGAWLVRERLLQRHRFVNFPPDRVL